MTPQKPSKTQPGNAFRGFALLLLSGILLAATASWVITDSLTFGYELPNWQKFIPRSEVRLTPEELAQFDGSDPTKPIYLAISGIIYDVSAGPQFYGKDGSYNHFSGRDASRSYITGCQDDHLTHDLRGLSEAQIKVWEQFYQTSNKYFKVGEVIHKPIDPNSPIPKDCGQ